MDLSSAPVLTDSLHLAIDLLDGGAARATGGFTHVYLQIPFDFVTGNSAYELRFSKINAVCAPAQTG